MKRILLEKFDRRLTAFFLFMLWVIFFYLVYLSFIKPIYQDEGVFLTIGKGIFDGSTPYLDYWDHKPPGMYYLAALLYSFFGKEILFYKISVWLVNVFSGILVFCISEKINKGSGKFSIIFFLISLIFFEGNYFIAEPFMVFFILSSVYCLLFARGRKIAYFISGILLFLAIMFKQTAILSILPIFSYYLLSKNLRKILAFSSGFIFFFILVLFFLCNVKISGLFWEQVMVSTFVHYPADRLINVLSAWSETFLRVWWLCLGVALFFIKKESLSKHELLLLLLAFLPICSYFIRPYPHYWIQVLPFLAIFSGIGFVKFIEPTKNSNKILYTGFLYVLIIFSLFQNVLWFRWVTQNLNFPRQIEQIKAVKSIEMFSPEYILAENYYTGFYFLTDSEPLTKYLYLTEVNEFEKSRQKTLEAIMHSRSLVILWPEDQKYAYAKEIGYWLEDNTKKLESYPSLNLSIFYKD